MISEKCKNCMKSYDFFFIEEKEWNGGNQMLEDGEI